MTITEDLRFLRAGYVEQVKEMTADELAIELQQLRDLNCPAATDERVDIVNNELASRKQPSPKPQICPTTTPRRRALACLLSDGLRGNWAELEAFDFESCTATVEAASPDIDGDYDIYEVGPRDVSRGLRLFRKHLERERVSRRNRAWKVVLFDRTNGEAGDYDAKSADAVMQFAIYGQIIFEV